MRWETHAVLLLLLVGVVAVAACADTGAVAVLVRSGAVPGCVVARVDAGGALVRGGVRALVGSRLVLALLRPHASQRLPIPASKRRHTSLLLLCFLNKGMIDTSYCKGIYLIWWSVCVRRGRIYALRAARGALYG